MPKYLLLIIALLIGGNITSSAQLIYSHATKPAHTPLDINAEYFILGTINDYMGRYVRPLRDNADVDMYFPYEKPLATAICSMIKKNYPQTDFYLNTSTNKQGQTHYSISSPTIAARINGYYQFKQGVSFPSGRSTGIITAGIFKNDTEKLAFLAGAYVRFGQPNDTAYCINIANSMSKVQVCYKLLKDFNCTATYKMLKGNIPVSHLIYFHPNKKVSAYLDKYMYLRKQIERSNDLMISKIIQEHRKRRS